MQNRKTGFSGISQYLWLIPAYYIAFELMNYSVSYFYSVVGTTSARNLVQFTYRLRDITMILSVVMMLLKSRLTWDSLLVTVLLWSVFYGTKWLFPQNARYIEEIMPYLLYGNVTYAIVRARMVSAEKFIRFCVVVSRIMVIMISIALFGVNNLAYYLSKNYMTFANALMLPLGFLIVAFSHKPKALDFALLVFGIILLLLFGSRGAVFVLVIQALMTYWQKIKSMKRKPLATAIMCAAVLLFAVLLLGNLDENILQFRKQGFGRTIQKLLSGDFFKSKRTQLWSFLLSKSWQDSLLGAGLGADRYYLPFQFTGVDATYAHNIAIEWIVDFGLIGGIGFILLTKSLLRPLFTVSSEEEKNFYIMIFSTSFLFLMISSSWTTTIGFYILCAISMNARHTNRITL